MTQMSREHEAHKTHHLKIYPEHFSAVLTGVKRAELRKNDRDYKAGDTLHLMETPKGSCSTTGEFVNAVVTHIADVGEWLPGYVLLSIEREPLYAAPQPVAVPDDLYKIANHIASAKGGLPDEWQDWAEEIETDIRRAAMLNAEPVSQPYTLPVAWVVSFSLPGTPGSDFTATFWSLAEKNHWVSLHESAGFSVDVEPLYSTTQEPTK